MAEAILNQPQFQDADKAREYLEALRWPNGPVCPHCGSVNDKHLALKGKAYRAGLFKCADCYEQFTVTVGTVFERSKIKLNVWLQAAYLMSASKKGISAKQLERMLGVTYKTAWFMAHRIREAMTPGFSAGPMGSGGGAVEVDETYYGRSSTVSHLPIERRRGPGYKMPIVSLVDRTTGEKRSFHMPTVNSHTLKAVINSQVARSAHLMTDESRLYTLTGRGYNQHSVVNHSHDEYARGEVTTNTVESSFSILKRGITGTFHSVSEKHLQRYCNEFDFRWNTRQSQGYSDTDRALAALKGIAGKRLTYRRIGNQQQANA
jgi:transposase-like protein